MFRKSLKAAVSVLAAGTALTACGPLKPGAAAVIGHDRITVTKLDAAVKQMKKELPKHPAAEQIVANSQPDDHVPFDKSSERRSALYQLIEIRVWDQVAHEKNITIPQGQVDAFVASRGGRAGLDAYVLAEGLPTSYDDAYARSLLIQQQLLQRYGINPGQPVTTPQQQQQVQQLLSDYAGAKKHLGITVNPRFGTFDDKSMTLGPVCPRLSTPDSGTSDAASGEVKCQV